MTKACLITEKETNKKYSILPRSFQAKALEEVRNGRTQKSVAEEHNIPRTTLAHWTKRRRELKGKTDPEIAAFIESPSGVAFLHTILVALFLIFHKQGACGLPLIESFLRATQLSLFTGASVGSLHKISKELDRLLDQFGEEEQQRLGKNMARKKITGCGDETFFEGDMIVVFMEAVSGFILAEQKEKNRDAVTWERVITRSLEGLNVDLIQVTGDEAGGLTSAVKTILGIHKSPDLFHIQQDITKGLTGHLGRMVKQAKDTLEGNQNLKKIHLERLRIRIQKTKNSLNDTKIAKTGKKLLELEDQEKTLQKDLEKVTKNQESARAHRRKITTNYHPFNLETGEERSPDKLEKELKSTYDVLEQIAVDVGCTDNQKKKLAKSRGMIPALVQTFSFFWLIVRNFMDSLQLTSDETDIFKKFLLPIQYLKIVEKRCGGSERELAQNTRKRLEKEFIKRDEFLTEFERQRRKELEGKAQECAEFFQRSSSCVEGHNATLSLKHHSSRCLSDASLRSAVVLHNFFIKRKDGTTAAERFFGQPAKDLFNWVLERISYPVRSRKKHTKTRKKTCKLRST